MGRSRLLTSFLIPGVLAVGFSSVAGIAVDCTCGSAAGNVDAWNADA